MRVLFFGELTFSKPQHQSLSKRASQTKADWLVHAKSYRDARVALRNEGPFDLIAVTNESRNREMRNAMSQFNLDLPIIICSTVEDYSELQTLQTAMPDGMIGKAAYSFEPGKPAQTQNVFTPGRRLADMERDLILETLVHCGGNRTYAADILGISIRTLRNKLLQYSDEGRMIPAPRDNRANPSTPVGTLLS